MSDKQRNWTREETMLAFELYCITPKGQDTVHNPNVIALSQAIGRTVNSVKLKLQNFKSYDPSYTQDGRVGLSHGSKLDEEICREFFQNWDSLLVETSDIKARLRLPPAPQVNVDESKLPIGSDKIIISKVRIGQSFFRQALLAAYGNKCCFTGIAVPELLRASHIKPWAESNDVNEKTNPQNGLLLNALHDAAFDKGFITITFDYSIIISQRLLIGSEASKIFFAPLHGKKILLPSRFLPDKQFIQHHNERFVG